MTAEVEQLADNRGGAMGAKSEDWVLDAASRARSAAFSRSDWLTELRDPTKAEAWRQFCHHWYLVVSDSEIVHDGELPEGWGMFVKHGQSLRLVKRAPRLTPIPMGMQQIAALTRAVMQTETRAAVAS